MMKAITVLLLAAISVFFISCAEDSSDESGTDGYKVHRLAQGMKIDGNWDKPEWQGASPIYVKNYMGKEPEFQPKVQAKALYDDNFIYIIFRVEDQYVVFSYGSAQRIRQLAASSGGRLRVVDGRSAYLPLQKEVAQPEEILHAVKSLLQPE